MDDLVEFGWYEPRGVGQVPKAVVNYTESITVCQKVIRGYVPINKYGAINYDYPIVLSDGVKVCFTAPELLTGVILDWERIFKKAPIDSLSCFGNPKDIPDNIQAKDCKVSYYTRTGDRFEKEFTILNLYSYLKDSERPSLGVRATRFINLEKAKAEVEAFLESPPAKQTSYAEERLNLHPFCSWSRKWMHQGSEFFDQVLETPPHEIEGDIVDGWVGTGSGLFWKRKGFEVETFIERKYAEKWEAYRTTFPLFLWIAKPVALHEEALEKELLLTI